MATNFPKKTEEVNFNIADEKKTNWIHSVGSVRDSKTTTVDWIHPGVLREGTVSMMCGLPGSGKSTFALKLADAIANERILMNHPHLRRDVLYLDRDETRLATLSTAWTGSR